MHGVFLENELANTRRFDEFVSWNSGNLFMQNIDRGRDTWWIRICEREFRSFKKIYNGARSFE